MIFSSTWHLPKSSNAVCPWLLPVTIVHAEGNKSVGPQFHLYQLFWPLGPISAIVSLFLPWESGRYLSNNPSQNTQEHANTWTAAKGWGTSVGTTHDAFSFSMYVQLPVHVQWEMFKLPKRKRGYISSLTSVHDALNTSEKEFTFFKESLPTHIIHHQDGWRFTSWPLNVEYVCVLTKIRKHERTAQAKAAGKSDCMWNNYSNIQQAWE